MARRHHHSILEPPSLKKWGGQSAGTAHCALFFRNPNPVGSNGSVVIELHRHLLAYDYKAFEISTDGVNWSTWAFPSSSEDYAYMGYTIPAGGILYIRGANDNSTAPGYLSWYDEGSSQSGDEDYRYYHFNIYNNGIICMVGGNVRSLLGCYSDTQAHQELSEYCFYSLFNGNYDTGSGTHDGHCRLTLTQWFRGIYSSVGENDMDFILDADEIPSHAYYSMFNHRTAYGFIEDPEYATNGGPLIINGTATGSHSIYRMFANQSCCFDTSGYSYNENTQKFEIQNEVPHIKQGARNPEYFQLNVDVNDQTYAFGCFFLGSNFRYSPIPTLNIPTNAGTHVFYSMYQDCTNLICAPKLPSTSLVDHCYQAMFYRCSGLIYAPDLPATTLPTYCYRNMFYQCTSLVYAPYLPATTLTSNCYYGLFDGCSSLSYVRADFTTTPGTTNSRTTNWLRGVSGYGVFVQGDNATWTIHTSGSNVPTAWKLTKWKGLIFQNTGAENITSIKIQATDSAVAGKNISVSTDNSTWTDYTSSTAGQELLSADLAPGDIIMLKGTNGGFGQNSDSAQYNKFIVTGSSYKAHGDIRSILNSSYSSWVNITGGSVDQGAFYGLFRDSSNLYEAPLIPLTVVRARVFAYMFYGAGIGYTPPLIFTSVSGASGCRYMFYNCIYLEHTYPILNPTSTGYTGIYFSMFRNCTRLTYAPIIKLATTQANSMYHMFRGCSALYIPPATLYSSGNYSHAYMFGGCTGLQNTPAFNPSITSIGTYWCYYTFSGCTSIQIAPELNAQTLSSYAYFRMFEGCTNLNYIKTHMTNISATNCLNNWVTGVNSTGDFYCDQNLNINTGSSGIPNGWTRHNL